MRVSRRPNATAETLPGLMLEWAQRCPDAVAMREKDFGIWNPVTWAEYRERIEAFALGLKDLGFGEQDALAIAGENVPEWLVADLAVQVLRGKVVGIYPTNPWPELRYIVEHSGSRVIVCTDQEQVDKVLDAEEAEGTLEQLTHILCIDMRGLRDYPRGRLKSFDEVVERGRKIRAEDKGAPTLDAMIAPVRPDDVCVVVYTSGTTGKPKGAMLTQANLVAAGRSLVGLYGLDNTNYQVLCYLPLCHVAERVYSIVFHLLTGGEVNFAESLETVNENLREIAPTVFLGVPRIWEKLQAGALIKLQEARAPQPAIFDWAFRLGSRLLEQEETSGATLRTRLLRKLLHLVVFRNVQLEMGLSRSRYRFCGGATVSPETLRFFAVIGLPVWQCFGMTETSGIVFSQTNERHENGCSGLPLEGVEYRVAEDGEILIRSATVFAGYLHDEAATADVFDGEWFKTGDIVEFSQGGELRVIDRKKAIIITSGGKNIAPSEIENALKESLFIHEAIVVGEGRKFLGGLIQIDIETVGKWAQQQGLAYTNYKDLAGKLEVRELIGKIVDEVNARFARVENIRKFVLLDKQLDHDDGEVTATQKVRRNIIETRFARELEEIYGAA